jgi:hypothetical protein
VVKPCPLVIFEKKTSNDNRKSIVLHLSKIAIKIRFWRVSKFEFEIIRKRQFKFKN